MSLAELLVIVIVAIIVFGPKKLPMLAQHAGLLVGHCLRLRQQAEVILKQQWQHLELLNKQQTAESIDQHYQTNKDDLKHEKDPG